MNTKEKIEVMQAWEDGKNIQIQVENGWVDWHDIEPNWNWDRGDYRIKPEPKEIWIRRFGRAYVVYEDEQEAIEDKTSDSSEPVKYREVLDDE